MKDDKVLSKSDENEIIPEEQVEIEVENDQMIPKARLDKVIEQREQALEELSSVKEKLGEIDTLKEQLEELKSSVGKKNEDGDVFTQEEESALSRIDKALKNRGYLTKDELEETRRIDRRNDTINNLSNKYHKGSGYPEFKTADVLVYAKEKGFGDNLEAAYRDMHWETITQVIAKRNGEGLEPIDSEKPVGGNRPASTELTATRIAEMDPNEYEKNRGSILEKFRKAVTGR